jgi:hypothetical protein
LLSGISYSNDVLALVMFFLYLTKLSSLIDKSDAVGLCGSSSLEELPISDEKAFVLVLSSFERFPSIGYHIEA